MLNKQLYGKLQQAIVKKYLNIDSADASEINENGTLLVKFNVSLSGVSAIEFISDGPGFIKVTTEKVLLQLDSALLSPFQKLPGNTIFMLPIKFYFKTGLPTRTTAKEIIDSLPNIDDGHKPIHKPQLFNESDVAKDKIMGVKVILLSPLEVYRPVI